MILETICIRVLKRCNLSCSHCWAGSSPRETDIMPFIGIMEYIAKLHGAGLRHVSISGGEPFLYQDLGNLVREAIDMGLYVTVTTNGYMGGRYDKIAGTINLPVHRRLRLRVSIDGAESQHDAYRGNGSYRRAVSAASFIKARHGWVGVNTVVLAGVETTIQSLCQDLSEIDADQWALMTPMAKGSYECARIDVEEIRRNARIIQAVAHNMGVRADVVHWDYYLREHGHVLLESDGRVILPGYSSERDVIVGLYDKLSIEDIQKAITDDAYSESTEFYSWQEWQ